MPTIKSPKVAVKIPISAFRYKGNNTLRTLGVVPQLSIPMTLEFDADSGDLLLPKPSKPRRNGEFKGFKVIRASKTFALPNHASKGTIRKTKSTIVIGNYSLYARVMIEERFSAGACRKKNRGKPASQRVGQPQYRLKAINHLTFDSTLTVHTSKYDGTKWVPQKPKTTTTRDGATRPPKSLSPYTFVKDFEIPCMKPPAGSPWGWQTIEEVLEVHVRGKKRS